MKKHLSKWLLYFITLITSYNISATEHNNKTEQNHTLVISHDYSAQQTINESSLPLRKSFPFSFHTKGHFDAEILGEKEKIILHDMKEVVLSFSNGKFSTVDFYPFPQNQWFTLEQSKEITEKIVKGINYIKNIATDYSELNLDDITTNYMNKSTKAAIGVYYLKNYSRLVIILRKLNTPLAIHPREEDYFQVYLVLDRKNEY